MKIAIDIDSTLHHYWDVLSAAAQERFGVELPYEEQYEWGVTRLKDEQLACVVQATHCDAAILAGRPYPGAVDAINRWADAGHDIHVVSQRATACQAATARWLEAIGLRYAELHCTQDKVGECGRVGIDLLVDDSPEVLRAAVDRGIAVATISHPWNEDVVAEEGVIAASDWPTLAARIEASLAPLRRPGRAGQVA